MLDVFFLPDENTLVFFERKKSRALKPNVMWCLSQVRIFFKNRFARRVPWVLKMWVKRYCWKRATPCQWWGLISIYLLSHSPSFKKKISLISYFGLLFSALSFFPWHFSCITGDGAGGSRHVVETTTSVVEKDSRQLIPLHRQKIITALGLSHQDTHIYLSFYRGCWNLRWRWWNIVGSVLSVRRWVWESEHGGFLRVCDAGVNS